MSEYSIKATSDGTISRIFVDNIGSVTAEGTKLLEIIPNDTPIVFYAKVGGLNHRCAFGTDAKITLSTMDSRNVVPIEANVLSIDPDATEEDDGSRHYSAILQISGPRWCRSCARCYWLGGNTSWPRTVFMYFLEPLWQAMEGALSEARFKFRQ